MVGGLEALNVKPTEAAGGEDGRLGPDDLVLLGLHVHQHGACTGSLVVHYELDGGAELHDLDLGSVPDLVPEGLHDLSARVVLCRVHPLAGSATTVDGDHCAVGVLVVHHPQLLVPLDHQGSVHDQGLDELRLVGEVAAAHDVQVMNGRRVLGFAGSLDAALGHHGVRVPEAQLGGQEGLRTRLGGHHRGGRTRTAATDDQHIHVPIDLLEVHVPGLDRRVGLQHVSELVVRGVPLVGSDQYVPLLLILEVGVIVSQDLVPLLHGQPGVLDPETLRSGGVHLLDAFSHVIWISHSSSPPR